MKYGIEPYTVKIHVKGRIQKVRERISLSLGLLPRRKSRKSTI